MMAYRTWLAVEDRIVEDLCLAGKHRFIDMMSFLPTRSRGAIFMRAQLLGVGNQWSSQKYFYDINYFAKQTINNCYHAGYLMADGNIHTRKDDGQVIFCWTTAKKDRHVLEDFNKAIKGNIDIKDYTRNTNKTKKPTTNCWFKICNPLVWKVDLEKNFGIVENKTYRSKMPKFDTFDHELSFAVGLLDGDGTITGNFKKKDTFTISLCGSSFGAIQWFHDLVGNLCLPANYRRVPKIRKGDDENCYYSYVRGLRAICLFHLLDAINVKKLDRKWKSEKILDLIATMTKRWPDEIAVFKAKIPDIIAGKYNNTENTCINLQQTESLEISNN